MLQHSQLLPLQGNVFLTALVEAAGYMAVAGPSESAFFAEQMANHLINGTTDAMLAKLKGFLRDGIRILCGDHREECVPAKK